MAGRENCIFLVERRIAWIINKRALLEDNSHALERNNAWHVEWMSALQLERWSALLVYRGEVVHSLSNVCLWLKETSAELVDKRNIMFSEKMNL